MKRLSSSERPLKVTCKNILLRLARLRRRDWNPYFSICIRNIYGHNITSDDASHTITYKILYLWGNMAIYGPRERPKIFKKGTFNKIFIRIGVGFMNYTGLENWVCNYTYITAVITDQGLSNVMDRKAFPGLKRYLDIGACNITVCGYRPVSFSSSRGGDPYKAL